MVFCTDTGVISALGRIYKPSNATTPAATITYGQRDTVASITDAASNASFFRSAPHRLESENPVGSRVVAYLDDHFRPSRSINPLGSTTRTEYDDAGLVLRTIAPEGNAVEYLYDVRGNRVRECSVAKGRVDWANLANPKAPQCNSNLGDSITTYGFSEGPTLRMDQCANLKTCNKPLYQIDPKGFRSNFSWDPSTGNLLSEQHGLDAAGNCTMPGGCPQTDYTYSGFVGTDGATFYLLTSKTEKIGGATNTTTTYSYDSANKFTLKQVVVDAGGLSLRTCAKYDNIGNLISVSDPRQGTCP